MCWISSALAWILSFFKCWLYGRVLWWSWFWFGNWKPLASCWVCYVPWGFFCLVFWNCKFFGQMVFIFFFLPSIFILWRNVYFRNILPRNLANCRYVRKASPGQNQSSSAIDSILSVMVASKVTMEPYSIVQTYFCTLRFLRFMSQGLTESYTAYLVYLRCLFSVF